MLTPSWAAVGLNQGSEAMFITGVFDLFVTENPRSKRPAALCWHTRFTRSTQFRLVVCVVHSCRECFGWPEVAHGVSYSCISETQTALQACQLVLVSTKVGWLTWAGCNIHLPWHAPVQIAGSYKIVTSHPTSTVGSISRSSGTSWLVLWAATSSVFNVMGKVLHCQDTGTSESSIVWNFARFCGPQCTPSWCGMPAGAQQSQQHAPDK
jgi:hypothetical protein